jgi:acetyl esterase
MGRQELTRKQIIRRGKMVRGIMQFVYKFQLFGMKHANVGKEVFLETEAGRARTLWYGFEDETAKPILFDMHGGGFILMHADADEPMNLEFAEKVGCKVISIDYAKAPEHPFPAALNEAYAVVKHVVEHAKEYGVDPSRMAIGGHSAGANLSAVTAMKSVKKGEFAFRCQVLDYPPLDLATSPYDKPNPKGGVSPRMATMFDRCYISDPADARNPYASPVYAAMQDLVGLPPAIVIVAGKDSLHDEGVKYANMLKDAGVETELHEFLEEAHGFTYKPGPGAQDAIGLMIDFMKEHLK